jgi:quercetin dioxygenase-like cupin family protein
VEDPVPNLVDLADLPPIRLFDGVVARRVEGERLTLAIVELEPNGVVPQHQHPYGTWRIPADVPHAAVAGPDGAVVIDVCSPIRDDWNNLPIIDRRPYWPR